MLIVIDTNVWLDWLVFDDPSVQALRTLLDMTDAQVVACPHARSELADVLSRPQFTARLPDPQVALARFDRTISMLDDPPRCDLISKDPDDQVFIDLAVASHARFLISRDKALLALAKRARDRHQVLVRRPVDGLDDPSRV